MSLYRFLIYYCLELRISDTETLSKLALITASQQQGKETGDKKDDKKKESIDKKDSNKQPDTKEAKKYDDGDVKR